MSDQMLSLIMFLCLSLVGFILIGVSLYTKRYQRKKEERETVLVLGRIVGRARKVNSAGRGRPVVYWVPVIAYLASGEMFELENENGTRNEQEIEIGKQVDVMYDPGDPKRFHLTEDDANEKGSDSLMRWGLIWVICAALLTLAYMFFLK